jgi:hypothetical protein
MLSNSEAPNASRFHGNVDYLLWWVKSAPLNAPLVSTGPPANDEGFLFNSDSTILYGGPRAPATGGNPNQTFAPFSGTRLNLGYWLDDEQRFGIEGGGFMLFRRTAGFAAQSDANGSPGMRIPVFNTVPYSTGGALDLMVSENGLPVAIPNILSGAVNVTNSLRLWGSDVTGVFNFYRDSTLGLSGLVGFRYLDLFESFNLQDDIVGIGGIFSGQNGTVIDHFQTRNQFYGGTLGLRGRYSSGPVSIDLNGRVALGSSHEVLNISGYFQAFNYHGPVAAGPEGIFAQPSNEGRRSANRFAVIPEVQLKIGYALTSRLRATVGYDFLYYSNVVRPGDQLDRNLPKGQVFQQGGTAISSSSPAALFNTTDFFAHGLSFGLDFRY